MSYPGVILRPLLPDEFSIYFDASDPIPLGALATFFGKLDRAIGQMAAMDGLIVELSDFALGSAEPRFRIVGPGRLALEEAARLHQEAMERNRPDIWQKVLVGATVVSAAATVTAAAISAGNLNPATCRLVNNYHINNIYVRAPDEPPHHIDRRAVTEGRAKRLRQQRRRVDEETGLEREALMATMNERGRVTVAGWLSRDRMGRPAFETMRGNVFPVRRVETHLPDKGAMVVAAQIFEASDGMHLNLTDFVAPLDDM